MQEACREVLKTVSQSRQRQNVELELHLHQRDYRNLDSDSFLRRNDTRSGVHANCNLATCSLSVCLLSNPVYLHRTISYYTIPVDWLEQVLQYRKIISTNLSCCVRIYVGKSFMLQYINELKSSITLKLDSNWLRSLYLLSYNALGWRGEMDFQVRDIPVLQIGVALYPKLFLIPSYHSQRNDAIEKPF